MHGETGFARPLQPLVLWVAAAVRPVHSALVSDVSVTAFSQRRPPTSLALRLCPLHQRRCRHSLDPGNGTSRWFSSPNFSARAGSAHGGVHVTRAMNGPCRLSAPRCPSPALDVLPGALGWQRVAEWGLLAWTTCSPGLELLRALRVALPFSRTVVWSVGFVSPLFTMEHM